MAKKTKIVIHPSRGHLVTGQDLARACRAYGSLQKLAKRSLVAKNTIRSWFKNDFFTFSANRSLVLAVVGALEEEGVFFQTPDFYDGPMPTREEIIQNTRDRIQRELKKFKKLEEEFDPMLH